MNIDLTKFITQNQGPLDLVLDLIPVPVFAKDAQGIYIACNKAFEEFIGISVDELIGKGVFDLWEESLAKIYHAKDKELLDSPGLQVYESEVINSDGKTITVQFYKSTFTDGDGAVSGLLGVIFDRTKEKALENELKQHAYYDYVTKLLNRRAGIDAMKRLIADCTRNERRLSVAILDIDRFKRINDTYGHEVGDRALRMVRKLAEEVLREYDLIFRHGGDEFILCFPDTGIDEAERIAERFREAFAFSRLESSTGATVRNTVSIGVASYPGHGEDIKSLIKACDEALYAAKHKGRNIVILAD